MSIPKWVNKTIHLLSSVVRRLNKSRLEAVLRTTPCWNGCRGYAENADEYLGLLCRDWSKDVNRGPAGGVVVVGRAISVKRSRLLGMVGVVLLFQVFI